MKTLHGYLTRQVLATLMMTVAVFTFVLLLGNGLKEILELLIKRQATLAGVAEAFMLLIPFVLVFALPMGMLTAALLVFGRFSADQELTAVRSSGISLITLVMPILVLSLLLCGLSAWINMEIAPQCRVAYKSLLFGMASKAIDNGLPEGRAIREFKGAMIYIKKVEGPILHDIYIDRYDSNNIVTNTVWAHSGRIDTVDEVTTVHLFQFWYLDKKSNGDLGSGVGQEQSISIKLNRENSTESKTALSDLTFRQLQDELRNLESSLSRPVTGRIGSEDLRNLMKQLQEHKADMTMPIRVQINRQVAISFACFGFTLVGIPLGIRAHRRETNIGIAMSLVLVFIYYSFIIVGQALQNHADFAPHLIVWVPNFLFQAVGVVMLWRANRGI